MRTGFDIRIDVVLEHCCHCYDNLGLRMFFWTKDTRSCSSHGQSDYLRSSFSTEKEYSNLSSKIRKVDCNTNSTMVFNLSALRPVTRVLLVSCTSPGVGKWVEKRVKNWIVPLSKTRLYILLEISIMYRTYFCVFGFLDTTWEFTALLLQLVLSQSPNTITIL